MNQGYDFKLPAKTLWPVGFTTDFVSFFPDAIPNRSGGMTSIRWSGFWHDLGYWHGRAVHDRTPRERLRRLRPKSNSRRSELHRRSVDRQFYANLRNQGVDRWLAWLMYRVVRRLGRRRYWWTRRRVAWEEA